MTEQMTRLRPIEVVTHTSQTDYQRLAMVMMQLDMALAMAREKGLPEVEQYLEGALAQARQDREMLIQ